MRSFDLTLSDQIPSGKNQTRKVYSESLHRMMIIPNERFTSWRGEAGAEILTQQSLWPAAVKLRMPLAIPLKIYISYHPLDKRIRDLPGCMDAIWHLLVFTRIIKDDSWLKGVTWEYPYRTFGPCVQLRLEYEE